jgi:hypothetical protein
MGRYSSRALRRQRSHVRFVSGSAVEIMESHTVGLGEGAQWVGSAVPRENTRLPMARRISATAAMTKTVCRLSSRNKNPDKDGRRWASDGTYAAAIVSHRAWAYGTTCGCWSESSLLAI